MLNTIRPHGGLNIDKIYLDELAAINHTNVVQFRFQLVARHDHVNKSDIVLLDTIRMVVGSKQLYKFTSGS